MTIKVELRNEAERIVEQQVAAGRYPDAESAVAAALLLLEDAATTWTDVDREAVRRMLVDADAEGGEISLDEAISRLDATIESAPHRR